ncbi:MAG: methyltransferase domain-containing protein [Acidiferrobacter sp.]
MSKGVIDELIDAAAAPYRSAGRFPWHFARGKLARDPIFAELLARGLIPDDAHILDLGCGLGLLSSWLTAAHDRWRAASWPASWPRPPRFASYHGIERAGRDAARAREALTAGSVTCGDIRTSAFGVANVVAIFDVLHYIDCPSQDGVLERVREALTPRGGLLLLRIGDAAAGWRFHVTRLVDAVMVSLRAARRQRLHCRPLASWLTRLDALGFAVTAVPMSRGTLFANVLLVARLPAAEVRAASLDA